MPGFQIYWICSLLYIVTLFHTGTSDGKVQSEQAQNLKLAPCRACKVLVDSFNKVSGMEPILMTFVICFNLQGLQRTASFKFEGGDADWEEKKLGSYANSEVRFVEIHEKLCSEVVEGKAQCYQLLEEYEEVSYIKLKKIII